LITLYAAMLVTLGFLIAALVVVVLLPAYRRRIERFTAEALKRTLPLTEDEIRADKDRLRGDFAIQLHKLETKVEEAALSAARQDVEINRRDAKIQELTEAIANHKMNVDEHENARRVLEQAILDRLPKVEQRLAETRKLLAARDREIQELFATSAKQANALEEAVQLNVQREKELTQLRASLETRSIRDRISRSDSRLDSKVALKTEIESLRAKNREQALLIERLQTVGKDGVAAPADAERDGEVKRLTAALAKTENELATLKAKVDEGSDQRDLEARIAEHEAREKEAATEIAKLKAALKAYEDDSSMAPGLSQKASISALQAEIDEKGRTIVALRAEIAAAEERLTRQALHFEEELRDVVLLPAGGAETEAPPKKSLAERISAPRAIRPAIVEPAESANAPAQPEGKSGSFLRALNGRNKGAGKTPDEPASPPPVPAGKAGEQPNAGKPTRRPRLLERISGIERIGKS
jgi:hypothetical protein